MVNKIIYLKNNILEILNSSNYPLSIDEILSSLKNEYCNNKDELLISLEELKNNNVIFSNIYNKFYLKTKNTLYVGKITINKKGFGFVSFNENKDSFYVHNKNINGALNNDEVLFNVVEFYNKTKQTKEKEAKIIKVLKRNSNTLIGTVKINKYNKKYLVIKNTRLLNQKATILNQEIAVAGNVVAVNIDKVIPNNGKLNPTIFVKITNILGHINDPGIDILSIVNEFGLNYKFKNEVYAEANKIPISISDYDVNNLKNRIDLTDELLVTIDGITAKDLDDAIRVKELENGNYSLLVAIADVSHYVKKDSAIDKTALERGASAYLVDRVIPMLPERLSNGICSLSADEYRFCLAIEMEINQKGSVVNSRIFQGLMKSKAKLTYDQVNKFFNNNADHEINNELHEMLLSAKKLYKILAKYKKILGMINLDIKEPEFILDDKGQVLNIKTRERYDAEKLIESFMIKANETVAEVIFKKKLPFIYRIHPKPKEEKIKNLWTQLSLLGINVKDIWNNNIDAKTFQKIIEKLEKSENNQLTLNVFLRSMEKAVYSQKNNGHFGLVSEYYTHFTSPIRRYPDLIVHRLLKNYIINDQNTTLTNYYNKNIQYIADKNTASEIKIVECEREVHKMKKAEYISKFIDKTFDGIISAVTSFGFFVALPNTVEGMVHISELDDDHYRFNEHTFKLVGERTNKTYSIGQKIKILVKNADKETRNIDFTIIK